MKRVCKFLFFSFSLVQLLIFFFSNDLYCQTNKVRVIKKDAALKLKPSNESLSIMDLPLGSEFDIEETIGEWVKVKLPPDKDGVVVTGFIHTSNLEFKLEPKTQSLPAKIDQRSFGLSKEEEYLKWQENIGRAKQKIAAGGILFVLGTAVLVPSLIYTFYNEREENIITGRHLTAGAWVLVIIGDVMGIGGIASGVVLFSSGSTRLAELNKVGKIKGYINAGVMPKYRALGVQIGASF